MTTGAASRVFLARLAGIRVFDPNGDPVGKVRDAIVVLRIGANPPRLTGLVVEVQPRRRIFVPMTKVTAIDAGQVIVTGTVNLRRFEKRSNETLVTAELLDRTGDLTEAGERRAVRCRARGWPSSGPLLATGWSPSCSCASPAEAACAGAGRRWSSTGRT